MFFRVKDFERHQHYKDRAPPWIKFYNSILDDYNYTRLPDASRSHLVAIMLLASRTENRIPFDAEWVRMAIKATTTVDINALLEAGFIEEIQDCSKMLATRLQDARPEREREQSRDRAEQSTAEPRPRANPDAVRILQSIVALFGESELTLTRWRWDQIDLLLAAGFLEREIMLAAEKTKSSGVVPTNLAKYLRPILDEMRVRPAPPRPHMNFKKIAG